jgi:formylglycine-generating enzyme required for sulfatase activity
MFVTRYLLLLACVASFALASVPAARGADFAFLVGVGGYDEKHLTPLKYARSDILAFHKALADGGFSARNVVLMHDDLEKLVEHCKKLGPDYQARDYLPEAARIRIELKLLLSLPQADDTVIVAFAGHGVQFAGEDRAYFCPLDAALDDPERKSLLAMDEIYAALQECPARRKLLLVDACRNDPQSRLSRSRETVKLQSVSEPQLTPPPEGVVALFSCAPGQQAFEYPDLGHGIFFHHVLQAFQGQGDGNQDQSLSLDELISYTKTETAQFARLKLKAVQTPRQQGFFEGDWVLRKVGPLHKPEIISKTTRMRLKLIPAGEFLMGSPETEAGRSEDEGPQHLVKITEPFYVGMLEVTQGEWQAVMGNNPSWFSSTGGGKDKVAGENTAPFPVEQVSWYDAIEFCNKLSARDGLADYYTLRVVERTDGSIVHGIVSIAGGNGYRLPTEAQWEYACRARTTTPFSFGTSCNGLEANVNGNKPYGTTAQGASLSGTTKAGSYGGNAFGVCDMHGSVWEWCFDRFDAAAYKLRTDGESNPVVETSAKPRRVLRGGGWEDSPFLARSSYRYLYFADFRTSGIGFRVLRSP